MLQVSLLLLSFAGYFLMMYIYFQGKNTALYPAILVSCITVIGFFAGLANFLKPAYTALYVLGFVLVPVGALSLTRSHFKPQPNALYCIFPFAVLLIGTFVLYFSFRGRFLYSYDDFTHWGKIARIIATNMRFPVEMDQLTHASYPPGSALFIAYIAKIVGNTESTYLFAQAFMLLCFWISILSSGKTLLNQIILAAFLFPLMNYNIKLEALSVDNLLAASTFACLMICLSGQRRPSKHLLSLSLSLCTLALIRNNGLFLFLLIALYALYLYRRRTRSILPKLLLLLPLIVILLWNERIDNTIVSQMRHQVSVDYYQQVFSSKSPADIRYILRLTLSLVFNPLRNHVLLLLPGYLLLGHIFRRQNKMHIYKHVFVFSAVLFLIYETGVILMYVYSMPMDEFLYHQGADYDRYNGTLTAIFLALLLCLGGRVSFPPLKKQHASQIKRLSCAVIGITALTIYTLSLQYMSFRPIEERIEHSKTAYHFSQMQDALSDLPSNAAYIIRFCEENDSDYNKHISRYYLHSRDIVCCYDQAEAIALSSDEKWKYYIDLCESTLQAPTETVGIELFAQANSFTYTNVLNTIGYKENTRYSLSATEDTTAYHWDITGYIPAKAGDIIRLQNVEWHPTDESDNRGGICWFTHDLIFKSNKGDLNTRDDLASWEPVFDESGNIIQLTIPSGVGASAEYFRIICQDINSDSIITVNEEI